MNASGFFFSAILVLLIFNVFYISGNPEAMYTMTIGAVVGFLATIMGITALFSIQILGSGLNSEAIKIIFGVGTIINILFQIPIEGFPIGLGLANNLIATFPFGELLNIPFFFASVFIVGTLISGIISVSGGAGGSEE